MFNQLDWPEPWRAARDAAPGDVTTLGQRTWHGVRTINRVIDGGDFSAAVLTINIEGRRYPCIVDAVRRPGADHWGLAGAATGEPDQTHNLGGDIRSSGHHCIGFCGSTVGYVKNVHAVEVEYADGSLHRAEREDDGCAILFAPVQSWDQKDNEVVVRYLDDAGGVVYRETYWLGAGLGPPGDADETDLRNP
jgi:hypothetical protein